MAQRSGRRTIRISLPTDLHRALKDQARDRRVSIAYIIRRLLKRDLGIQY